MDFATLIGIVTGVGLLVWAMAAGGQAGVFVHPPSLAIVLGGTLAATLIHYPLGRFIGVLGMMRQVFVRAETAPSELIDLMVRLAEQARREGLLSLEDEAGDQTDPFLKKGLQLVVDGTDPELVKSILETELAYLEERHQQGQGLFETMGALAPAFGLIGTLIGLVRMLQNLGDAASVGPGLAVALVTTFYGALLANLLFIPMAGKLKAKSQSEVLLKEVAIEGILSIQAGDSPRILEQKLRAFLSPKLRDDDADDRTADEEAEA